MRRSQRSDDYIDREALVAALKVSRDELVRSMSRMTIHGPLYKAASDLLSRIDEVVYVLTDDRRLLHAPQHGTRPR